MLKWIGVILAVWIAYSVLGVMDRQFGLTLVAALAIGLYLHLRGQLNGLRDELKALRASREPAAPHRDAAHDTVPDTVPDTAPTELVPGPPLPVPTATADGDLRRAPALQAGPRLEAQAPTAASATPPQPTRSPAAALEVDEHTLAVTTSLGASIKAWLRGGNTIVRLAVLILFVGVAFLLRYAAEHALLPIELRLAAVALGGVALAVVGWRLRDKRRGYGLTLQGAGVGVLYLTLFAAMRLYQLVPPLLVFPLLMALGIFTALLAVWQDALPLAVLGFAGGFLAPVLTSTGQGSHVVLFSYYFVLNLGIAWIAGRKAWKLLNLVGFAFTFLIGLGWGLRSWQPELLASTEPFLIAHVLLYLYIAVQYSRRLAEAAPAGVPYVDAGLVFGMPLVALGLQAGMVRHIPYALAVSALVMAAVYLLLGRWLWRRLGERMRLFTEGMLALGVVFLALVAPLALDARWTSAAWAVQGAGVAWVALRQQRTWALAMGLVLQLMAALSYWSHPGPEAGTPFVLNAVYTGAWLLALSALFSAFVLQRRAAADGPAPVGDDALQKMWRPELLRGLHWGALGLGVLHAAAGSAQELARQPWLWPDRDGSNILMFAAFALVLEALHRPLRWRELAVPARPLLGLALAGSLVETVAVLGAGTGWNRLSHFGFVEVVLLLAASWWLLRRLDHLPSPQQPRGSFAMEHLVVGWYAMAHSAFIVYTAVAHAVNRHEGWTITAVIVLPTAIAWAALGAIRRQRWPAARHPLAWRNALATPWLAALLLWSVGANAFDDASMRPLPYLPLLNPVDLGHGLILLYALRLRRAWLAAPSAAPKPVLVVIAAACGFWWLNSLLIRTLHHWAGTPMWIDDALRSGLVHTALTILWTVSALAVMLYATRRAAPGVARRLWLVGATLLGVVVLKLMLIDLSHTSALERIVSFMGVGVLMLVIGYVSPLPPAPRADRDTLEPAG